MTRWKLGAWRDWASLVRLPNLPTVWSNVFTAWVLAGGMNLFPPYPYYFGWALVSWTLLYAGGAMLNDVNDVNYDRLHRAERALPSGRIGINSSELMAAALLLGALMTGLGGEWIVLVLILLYAILHKRIPVLGVIIMGLCRFGLGAMAYGTVQNYGFVQWPYNYEYSSWLVALFGYVAILSLIAKDEADLRVRNAVGWMLAGLPLLDAGFLLVAGFEAEAVVPLACFVTVLVLRRVAPAT